MFSSIAAAHVQAPRNVGPLEEPCRYGVSGVPGDGPYVEIWIDTDGTRIKRAAYRTPGCPSSTASASVLCELVTGREIDRVRQLTDTDLLAVLGGLPEGKGFYAGMAIEAVMDALERENDRHAI